MKYALKFVALMYKYFTSTDLPFSPHIFSILIFLANVLEVFSTGKPLDTFKFWIFIKLPHLFNNFSVKMSNMLNNMKMFWFVSCRS